MAETVVLLHGFASSHRSWDAVLAALAPERYRAIAPDIRGHGAAAARRPIGWAECVTDVAALVPGRFALCGYSMGGRLALHVAAAIPERITRLVLVSCGAGIEDPRERRRRRDADEALATVLENEPIERFVARWGELALFADDPPAIGRAVAAEQRTADPAGLAAALRGLGQGTMPPLWERLGELRMPAVVMAGARDERYVGLGERLAELLGGPARLEVLAGAGHRLALERADAVAAAIAG